MALQSVTALASIILQEESVSLSLSNIPQNYRDLILVVKLVNTTNSRLVFNDNTSGYSLFQIFANASEVTLTNSTDIGGIASGGNDQISIHEIFEYSQSNKQKSVLTKRSQFSFVSRAISMWENTASINSMELKGIEGGILVAGTEIELYGRIA